MVNFFFICVRMCSYNSNRSLLLFYYYKKHNIYISVWHLVVSVLGFGVYWT